MLKISLAAARVNANLTQKEAAKLLNINKCTMINWEKGKSSPKYTQMKKLCELYGVTLDDIFLPSGLPKVEQN